MRRFVLAILASLLTFPAMANHADDPEHQHRLQHAREICEEYGFDYAILGTARTWAARCIQEEYRHMQEERILESLFPSPDIQDYELPRKVQP